MQTRLLQRTPRSDEGRRGAVLILALIAVVTVSTMAAGFLQLSAARTRSQVGAIDRKGAFYLAEAGLAEAYVGLRAGRTGNVGTEEDPAGFGDGLFWVEAEDLGNDQIALHSTGMAGRARVALDIIVERDSSSSTVFGVYTTGALSLGAGTRIDSYDSSAGTYEEQVGLDTGLAGVPSIGTGSDLALSGTSADPVLIRGDVSWGPGGNYTPNEDVYIGGEAAPAGAGRSLSAIEFPSLVKEPGVVHSSGIPLIVAPGEYALESLVIDRDSDVILEGPMVLLVGDLEARSGARLVADTSGGTVDLYVEDTLAFASQSVIENTTEDPQSLLIQHAGSAATFAMSGAFFGALYAPNAEVNVQRPLEVFGSLVAAELSTSSKLTLHFDRAAAKSAARSRWPQFLTWRIVEMIENPGGVADPFRALGVVSGTLDKPADAHADQTLVMDYLDDAGAAQSYNGPANSFDWTDVQEIQSRALDGDDVDDDNDDDQDGDFDDGELSPTDQVHSDYIDSGPSAGQLQNYLYDNQPLSDEIFAKGLRAGIMSANQTRWSLEDNSPLSAGILTLVLDGTIPLTALELADLLALQ